MTPPKDRHGLDDDHGASSHAQPAPAPETVLRKLSRARAFLGWEVGPDGSGTWFSDGWLALTGRPLSRELGRGWTEGLPPGDVPLFLRQLAEGLAGRSAFRLEYRLRAEDGTYRDLTGVAEPSLAPDGSVLGCVGYAVDLTRERESQRALRLSEERFRVMAETVPDILFTARPDGVLDFVNRRFYEYTGLSEGWAINPGWTRVLHPEDAAGSEPVWLECCRQGRPYVQRSRLRARDGSYRWFVVRSTSVQDDSGKVIGCFGCCTDIEELVAAERAVQERERLFRTLCSNAAVGIMLADTRGAITFVNDRLVGLTGRTRAALQAEGWLAAVHDADRDRVRESSCAALREATGWTSEHRLLRPDGRVVWVHCEMVPLHSEAGEVTGHVGTVSDISKLKRAEEELSIKARELSRSNIDLEQFASTASHDLREPLAVADLYLKVLEDRSARALDQDARHYLEEVRQHVRQVSELLIGLLAYSRVRPPGAGHETCASGAALADALGSLAEVIRESGAEITHEPMPTLPIDHTRLMQLLQNLIGNAIKYRGDSPPRIHVSVRREARGWVLSVRDNGIGIDPRDTERVFHIFWRGTTGRAGTGVGLAICKRIANQVGGRIWVESAPGRGSTFHVSIPD